MRTQSSYRGLFSPDRRWRCINIQKGNALEPIHDTIIIGNDPQRWFIVVENRHEAWLWDAGTSPNDTNKWWYRVEFNHHLDSRWENRTDMKDWDQEYVLERGKSVYDWPTTLFQCIEFEKKVVNKQ
jgi:hypothetical protein